MFDALVNGRIDCGELTFEVAYYDIEELNRRAEAGETDVSKISYACCRKYSPATPCWTAVRLWDAATDRSSSHGREHLPIRSAGSRYRDCTLRPTP